MHMSLPGSGRGYWDHWEFAVTWVRDTETDQAVVRLASTDEIPDRDPLTPDDQSFPIAVANWASPVAEIEAGLMAYSFFSAATFS